MYVQTPGRRHRPAASDAVFVYGNSSMPAGVAIGDSVQVTGAVSEFAGLHRDHPGRRRRDRARALGDGHGPRDRLPDDRGRPRGARGRAARPDRRRSRSPTASAPTSTARSAWRPATTRCVQPTEVAATTTPPASTRSRPTTLARGVVLDDGTGDQLPHQRLAPAGPAAAVADPDQRRPRGRRGDLPRAGDPRLPQQRLEVPAVPAGQGRRRRRGRPSRTPATTTLAPQPVGGDLKLATFNVLNFFNTTGEQYVAQRRRCRTRPSTRRARTTTTATATRSATTPVVS